MVVIFVHAISVTIITRKGKADMKNLARSFYLGILGEIYKHKLVHQVEEFVFKKKKKAGIGYQISREKRTNKMY